MSFQQLPGSLVLNFFIKNTFIVVPTQSDEASDADARRCKSAPAHMRFRPEEAPDAPPRDDWAGKDGHIVAEDNERVDQVVEDGS